MSTSSPVPLRATRLLWITQELMGLRLQELGSPCQLVGASCQGLQRQQVEAGDSGETQAAGRRQHAD